MLIVETLTLVGGAGLPPQATPKAATASPNAKDRYLICLFLPERNAAPGGEQEEYQRKLLARMRVVWTETYGRSEERRVGKECRCRRWGAHCKRTRETTR